MALIKKRITSDKKRRELLSGSKATVFTLVLVHSCSIVTIPQGAPTQPPPPSAPRRSLWDPTLHWKPLRDHPKSTSPVLLLCMEMLKPQCGYLKFLWHISHLKCGTLCEKILLGPVQLRIFYDSMIIGFS